ncbi:MAG: tetratricopeptide repeat protein [Magnetococcales bacterium]|nr:tetratricopeptide repeat protein [Magnetococcales bacterium]
MRAIPRNPLVPRLGRPISILLFVFWGMMAISWTQIHAEEDARSQLANAQTAIRRAVDRYGPNTIETVPPRMALAELHMANGDFPKAEPLLQQALNISIRVNGTSHKSLLPILERLAWIDIRNNRFSSGKQFYSDAIEIARKTHGSNSPIMQKLLDSLADAREKERQMGNLPAVHRKQTPPTQESADPTYDLVIANQNQPPPPVVPATTVLGNQTVPSEAVPSEGIQKTKDLASQPPVAAPVVLETPAVASPQSHSPFLFGVTTPQPVTWQPPSAVATVSATPPPPAPAPSSTVPATPPPPEVVPPQQAAKVNTDGGTMVHEGWFITTGCFSQSIYGDERLEEIRKLNLPAYAKQNRSGAMTCVYSGPYPEQSMAESALGTIKNQGGMNDSFIRPY